MAVTWEAGTQRLITSSVIGVSGRAIRIYQIYCISGADLADFNLRNGSSASGTIFIQKGVPNPGSIHEDYGMHGHLFPLGCYAEFTVSSPSIFLVSFLQ